MSIILYIAAFSAILTQRFGKYLPLIHLVNRPAWRIAAREQPPPDAIATPHAAEDRPGEVWGDSGI